MGKYGKTMKNVTRLPGKKKNKIARNFWQLKIKKNNNKIKC